MASAPPPEVAAQSRKRKLARRDWVILPMLSLLTVGAILAAAEVTTRMIWVEGGEDSCRVRGLFPGQGNKPNCIARMKVAEGPWVEYRYNECGYRTAASCGPKPQGTVRVALMGASLSEGHMIPYEEAFATRTANDLSRICLRPVEFQNMGTLSCWPACVGRRLDEALALRPDAVMVAIAPYDVSQIAEARTPAASSNQQASVATGRAAVNPIDWLADAFSGSRTVLVAKHFLYEDEQTYLRLYLLQGDKIGFLRQPFSATWERRFEELDLLLGEMAEKNHAAGVPLALTAVPEHAQTILLNPHNRPPGIDPYAFNRKIAEIAAKHDIVFIDLFNDFARAADPNSLFYPEDGHLTPEGHLTVSRVITRAFVGGEIGFSGCTLSRPSS